MSSENTPWNAQWIGRGGACLQDWSKKVLPAPLFRQEFALEGPVSEARVRISGLGYFVLSLNGRRVGDHVLDPLVTQYDQHVNYIVHDVTEYLQSGANVIGVVLGNGWYNCHTAEVWHFDKAVWRDYPKLLCQLDVSLTSGGRMSVCSGPGWKTAEGPIRFDGLRNGEHYDARCEKSGWDSPGYNDEDWGEALVVPGPGGLLQEQRSPPCKIIETITPVSVREIRPGVAVYDLGQNIAGWAQLSVSGPEGTEITLRYAEKLKEDGEVDQANIARFIRSGECQTDRYTLKGDGNEVWEPQFTYHGFQYVQVEGLPGTASVENIRGRVVHTAFDQVGQLETSSEDVNSLQRLTAWAYRGNFVGIPTDCPHREKNGWTGDAQLAAETGLMNFDAASSYAHWMRVIADTQRPNGQLPGIAPTSGWGYNWGSGPAWDSAFLLIPWIIYLYTGDLSVADEHYEGMRRYVDFCTGMATEGIASFGLGDWCPANRDHVPEPAMTSTAYYYVDARLVARIAELTGRHRDHEKYSGLARDVRSAFNGRFYHGEGVYGRGEQTALGCALYQGLVEESERKSVVQRLVEAVESNGCRPDFGILGAKYVPRALAQNGRADLAYRLITQPDYPGWVHWLRQGATTLWESWDGNASRNHIMFGDISAWMYHYLAGIAPDPERPGFENVLMHPIFPSELNSVRAEHRGPHGVIGSSWQRTPRGLEWTIDLPEGTTAKVELPGDTAGSLLDGAPLASERPGSPIGLSGGKHTISLRGKGTGS